MIANDQELKVTLERIAKFQQQVAHLRNVETNPENYHGSASGFLAEIARMQLEVREYLSLHPSELSKSDAEPGLQPSRKWRVGFACKSTHDPLMPDVTWPDQTVLAIPMAVAPTQYQLNAE